MRTILLILLTVSLLGCGEDASTAVATPLVTSDGADNVDASAGVEEDASGETSRARRAEVAGEDPVVTAAGGNQAALEQSLLQGDDLGPRAQNVLKAPEFEDFVSKFEREHAGNLSAYNNSSTYAAAMDSSMAAVEPQAKMSKLACGRNVCMGYTYSDGEGTWFPDWYNDFAMNSEVPIGALTYEDVPQKDGRVQHRILLTLKAGGGTVVPPPQRQ